MRRILIRLRLTYERNCYDIVFFDDVWFAFFSLANFPPHDELLLKHACMFTMRTHTHRLCACALCHHHRVPILFSSIYLPEKHLIFADWRGGLLFAWWCACTLDRKCPLRICIWGDASWLQMSWCAACFLAAIYVWARKVMLNPRLSGRG